MSKWEGQETSGIAAPSQNISLHPYHSGGAGRRPCEQLRNISQLLISRSAGAVAAEPWEAAAVSSCRPGAQRRSPPWAQALRVAWDRLHNTPCGWG